MNDQASDVNLTNAKPAEELARADAYGLLAALLSDAPDSELLGRLGSVLGDESEFGQALDALAEAARLTDAELVREEYEALFIGLGRGELVPHGSFYLTGFLNEKPLARLRADLSTLGVERSPDNKLPEDHIASVCEVMAGIIRGDFVEQGAVCQKTFFKAHVAPWAPKFFEDLSRAKTARFYVAVGKLGALLSQIDEVAFEIAA